ncbi:hypothetical protein BG015_006563 [Linnemannia schmuckeri]|uniref:Uncharacterized protein n=1 Tax=Linnemannia schmuckeri TaxID=64567 RepID=A0A9P5VBV3_9FUNG|nr:hypothetical protein BG015_006563 [Linnemannia schmuckeri]
MDLIARLPLECLQQILASLHQDEHLSSLAALLATNKYIASVALPYIYTEPFRAVLRQKASSAAPSPYDPSVFAGKLTRLLLSRDRVRRQGEIHKALMLAFNLEDTHRSNERGSTDDDGPLDYFAHIRDLSVMRWSTGPHHTWDFKDPPPEILAYFQTDDFKFICRRMEQNLCPEYARRFQPEKKLLFHHFRVILNRELNWVLARPVLGQLRTLTIPTSDIGRYLGVVGQLAQLEHLQFRMDEAFDFEAVRRDNTTPEAIEFAKATKERKEAVMRDVVRFVEALTRLFPGTVKTATFSDAGLWPWIRQVFPEETQFEVFRLLPPLVRPTTLMPLNWLQFTAHPLETDLGQVKEIKFKKTVKDSFGRLREKREFLQRCRTLMLLDIPSLGQGSFAWAVQEKRNLDAFNNNTSTGSGQGQGQGSATLLLDMDRPAYIKHGLVPLENVEIREFREPFTDEVDDIAFAFSQTLTRLKADASSFIAQLPRSIHFGRGWITLPNLKHLSLNAKNARLIIDRHLLSLCPNIEHIDLADQTHEYRCQDLQEPCLPASLGQLKTMTLVGWAALTFHPDTLNTTPELTYLHMSTYMDHMEHRDCFIPPINELNRSYGITTSTSQDGRTGTETTGESLLLTTTIVRPQWSWNWHLPHLKSVYLTSEFAYRFQFRMLRGCPALGVLDLNISTANGRHPREITISDLYAPAACSHHDNDNSVPTTTQPHQRQERVVAPLLRSLRLVGRWILKDAFLPEFLIVTFPNLRYFTEKNWDTGIGRGRDGNTTTTVAGLIRCIRAAAVAQKFKLEVLDLTLPEPFLEERTELGMVTGYGVPEGKTLPVTIYFAEMQYVLLVDPSDCG